MAEGNRPPLVAVLAAGSASRFGGGKLDAMLAGKPVGQWVLDAVAAAGLEPGVIVVGPKLPQFAEESGWPLITNINASDGLGSSLALAASAALAQGRALLVLLADMPLLDPAFIAKLAGEDLAATRYANGRPGVPALIKAELLPSLANLAGDQGAAQLLAGQAGLKLLEPPADMLLDVDTPQELALAEELLSELRT